MDLISDFVYSTPVLGHGIAFGHLLTGDSKNGIKAFVKATRSTAGIVGATVGGMVGGPVGAVAGSIYGGATVDTIATAATDEEHGYIKHTADIAREVADGNFPVKPAIRAGLQLGFDAAGGKGMNLSRPNSISEMTSTLGKQIYKKSLGMDKEALCKKFTKHAIKYDAEMALKLIPDNRAIEKEKGRKKKSKKKSRKMVDYDYDSDYDFGSDSDSEYITYKRHPYSSDLYFSDSYYQCPCSLHSHPRIKFDDPFINYTWSIHQKSLQEEFFHNLGLRYY